MRQVLAAWLILFISVVLFASLASALSLVVHSEQTVVVISLVLVSPLSVTAHVLLQRRDYYLTSPARERRRDAKIVEEADARFVDVNEGMVRIKVVGVGGAGLNAVNRMIQVGVRGVEFLALNTDAQSLAKSNASVRMRIGHKTSRGLGAGGDPGMGEQAVKESAEEIAELLRGADMVFVTAGMGGGTGTGGAPLVAEIARGLGALTVAVVTKPFSFEGGRRIQVALDGLERLRRYADTLVVIPNDRLLQIVDRKASIRDAFLAADDLLRQGIQGVSDLITGTGLVNVDFNDVRAIMKDGGTALMAIGIGRGETRALDAATQAVNNQLLDVTVDGAKGVLFNVKGGKELTLYEVNSAAELIRKMVDPDANIIFGATIDESLAGQVHITVIATGFDGRIKASSARRPVVARQVQRDKLIQFPLRKLEQDQLDIPAFLRR